MGDEQGRVELFLKAAAYDRILQKFLQLRENADFYSKNWVELAELIEAEQYRIRRRLEGS